MTLGGILLYSPCAFSLELTHTLPPPPIYTPLHILFYYHHILPSLCELFRALLRI